MKLVFEGFGDIEEGWVDDMERCGAKVPRTYPVEELEVLP